FREDLYFRLSVFPIDVPPLRNRREDIPALAGHFLGQVNLPTIEYVPLREDVARELVSRSWSGNVRELRNAIERAPIVARGRDIRTEHLPSPAGPSRQSPAGARDGLEEQIARWTETELREASLSATTEPTLYDRFLTLIEPPLL